MEIAELKKKTIKWTLTVIGCAAAMYFIVRYDVISRARESYEKAEKSYAWWQDAELKKKALAEELEKEKMEIEKKYKMSKVMSFLRIISGAKGRLSEQEYKDMQEDAKNENERLLEENDLKYAFVWYQTAVEMFSPPLSRWVRISLPKMYDMTKKLEGEKMYILAREGYESVIRFDEKYPGYKDQAVPDWKEMVAESKRKVPEMWDLIEKRESGKK